MTKKLYFTIYFVLILSTQTYCQQFSYGIKASYITQHRLYGNTNINGTQITGNKKNALDGFRFAGLARYEYKRWFAATELAYAYN
jgi:hypothetical protein